MPVPAGPSRDVVVVPEWFGGGMMLSWLPLSIGVRRRLKAWNQIWEEVLDPVTEIRWPDPDVGRQWIAEGAALVRDIQGELGPSYRVRGEFAAYDPDAQPPSP